MKEHASPSDHTFESRLAAVREMADELPAALIIHRTEDLSVVYMNQPGLDQLGISNEELQSIDEKDFQLRFYNVEESGDYVPKILHIIRTKASDQVSFFQHLRNPGTDTWQLYSTNTKVFCRDASGEPTHIITVAGKIDPLHHVTSKVTRLMDEISFFKSNIPLFLSLTKREKEILRLIALGKSTAEISETFFISPATVETHRKNIRNKLHLRNNYDTVLFAQAYNLL
jgi:DNA-binding CsgD family transcriptional regulator